MFVLALAVTHLRHIRCRGAGLSREAVVHGSKLIYPFECPHGVRVKASAHQDRSYVVKDVRLIDQTVELARGPKGLSIKDEGLVQITNVRVGDPGEGLGLAYPLLVF